MSDLGYLLRALLGKPDVELNNAQVRAEGNAMRAQSRYNQWRRKTGRIPVDYNRVRSIVAGERTSPLLNHPVNYNDPADVWRAHKNMMDYARIIGAEANPNEKAYRNKEIAPRDKAMMGAPLVPKMPAPRNLPEKPQNKIASAINIQTVQQAMTKRAALSWNPLNWFKSEDEYQREQYDKQRMTALQQFENNMNALDPGRAQRMAALQQRDAMLAQQVDANLRAHAAGQTYQSIMAPNSQQRMVAGGQVVRPGTPNLIDPAAAARTMQSPGYIAATPTVDANGQTIRRPGMDSHITGSYTINGTRYNRFSDGAITTQPQPQQFLAQQKHNDQMIAQQRQQKAPQMVTAGTASGRPAQTSASAARVAQTRPAAQQRPAQAVPPPSAAQRQNPAATTQRRQGYKTPDGQWHDITSTTKAPMDVQVGTFRQPKPKTSNPAALPKAHFQYKPKY